MSWRCELDEELTKIEVGRRRPSRDPHRRRPARLFRRRRYSSDGQIHARGNGRAHRRAPRSQLAPGDLHQADHRRDQWPRLRRRRAADDHAGHPHRLRTRRDPISRGEIRPRQFYLVPAADRRHAESQRIALHRAGRSKPKKRNASACSIRSCLRRNCATLPSRWRNRSAPTIRAWCKASSGLLDDGVGMAWRERFDAEQNARKGKLKANSPREGFKAFLDRKGIR